MAHKDIAHQDQGGAMLQQGAPLHANALVGLKLKCVIALIIAHPSYSPQPLQIANMNFIIS